MKPISSLWWLSVGTALLICSAVRAQNNCPEGKYQASPPDVATPIYCAPIPHDRQGLPLPTAPAATHWGAIATDAVSEHIGTTIDQPTKSQAEQMALSECRAKGGSACKTAIAYGNGCAVLLTSSSGYITAADVTIDHATQTGMKACGDTEGSACHVTYSACSPAQPMH